MNEDNAFQRSNDLLDTGAEAYRNGDYLTAQKYYTQAAKLGNAQAMCNLGYIYEYGRTGQRDYKKAFYCFKMAADKDNAVACYKVGDICFYGDAFKKDYDLDSHIIKKLRKLQMNWIRMKTSSPTFIIV